MKPIVAIVGRPNVGKSTFYNRITRTKGAMVDDLPGVTRDRNYGDATWDGVDFTVVDTGGFYEVSDDEFADQIRFQLFQAIEDADVVIHMLDGKAGVSPFDTDLIEKLRSVNKPVFYAVNKIDREGQEEHLYEFYNLGIEKLYPLSAEHGYGTSDLMDEMLEVFPKFDADINRELLRVAVVGRPNVGKSSLINRILGKERLLVSEIPGTTRDAIDTVCKVRGKEYLLVDTAGIRRKGRVKAKIEKFSIVRALRSLNRCDVALMVLDAGEGVTDQDVTIAGYAFDRGCGCILLLNKWDLVDKDTMTAKRFTEQVRTAAKFLSFAPVMTMSAKTGLRVTKIFNHIDAVYEQYTARITTGALNRIVERAIKGHEPALFRGRRIKFFYTTQIKNKPPTFICFVNYPDAVHFSYQRYLTNQIRMETGLDQVPIRLYFRKRPRR